MFYSGIWWQKGEGVQLGYYFGKQEGMKGWEAWCLSLTWDQAASRWCIANGGNSLFSPKGEYVFCHKVLVTSLSITNTILPFSPFSKTFAIYIWKTYFLIILLCLTFFTFRNITVKLAWKRHEESQLSVTVLSNSPFTFQMQNLACRILVFLWFIYNLWQSSQR